MDFLKLKIIGKIKAISTSKIKKIIVIKKNRREKGIREEDKGSNPHSKGEDFSWFSKDFLEIKDANEFINKAKIKQKKKILKINKIIYSKIDFLVGS